MKIIAVLAPVIAIIALLFAYGLSSWIGKMDEGTERMKEISGYIREGAMAFLKREYKAMVIVILVLFIILGFAINWTTAVLYIIGAIFSVLAGFFGMRVAIKGNVRTISAAMNGGFDQALKVAFRSGAVVGLCVISFGLLGLGGIFVVLGVKSVSVITGFGLGASSIALFSRVGSGIYAKGVHQGVDQLSKAQAGMSEDNPGNPAVIADYVGVNASSAAGMSSDLFESYVSSILSVIILAVITKSIDPKFGYPFDLPAMEGSVFPLILSAIGIIASILGIMFVRENENRNTAASFKIGSYISNVVFVIFSIVLSRVFFGNFNCGISVLAGFIAGIAIGMTTEIYTSENHKHVKNISKKSQTGYAATILSGYGTGMLSTAWIIIIIVAGILAAHAFAGFYGIALAAVGLLSSTGIVMSANAFGAISNNASGIVRMVKLPDEVASITKELDTVGNKTAATRRVFSICAAALTALALLISYSQITELKEISIMKPIVLAGMIFGAMLPFLFSALTLNSVEKVTSKVIEEVRKQFHVDASSKAGTSMINHAKCVDISAKTAMKGMTGLGFLTILIPLTVGILLGTEVLGSMLAGFITSGVLLSIVMTSAGSVWENAKKHIEEGNFGGKGSDAHKAAVIGDAVGNPFKDTAGPSIGILIKLMAIIAVVFAPIFVAIGGLL